jgi:hypothetical protein
MELDECLRSELEHVARVLEAVVPQMSVRRPWLVRILSSMSGWVF